MFRLISIVFLVGSFFFALGCGEYKPQPQLLPQHVRTIAVKNFANKTANYGLEEKLTLAIVHQFIQDGRVQISGQEKAEGLLSGEITRYILEPLSYDANQVVEEYKLWVLVDVSFTDLTTGQILWIEENLEAETRFFVVPKPGMILQTEEEAREVVWDLLSRSIVKRTIEGFGKVTGASERRVPAAPK